MAVNFFTEDIKYVLRDKLSLRKWLVAVAKKEGFKLDELNIILCSDEFLFTMNVEYLNHKTYTDIITFDQSETVGLIQGELYISIDRVRQNSLELNIALKEEIHRVMVHGLLHLCGYSDKSPQSKLKMSKREDFHLKSRSF